jgi:hypothetical protein
MAKGEAEYEEALEEFRTTMDLVDAPVEEYRKALRHAINELREMLSASEAAIKGEEKEAAEEDAFERHGDRDLDGLDTDGDH